MNLVEIVKVQELQEERARQLLVNVVMVEAKCKKYVHLYLVEWYKLPHAQFVMAREE